MQITVHASLFLTKERKGYKNYKKGLFANFLCITRWKLYFNFILLASSPPLPPTANVLQQEIDLYRGKTTQSKITSSLGIKKKSGEYHFVSLFDFTRERTDSDHLSIKGVSCCTQEVELKDL